MRHSRRSSARRAVAVTSFHRTAVARYSRSVSTGTAILDTPRLILRPMRPDDVGPLHALFGDPAFMTAFDSPPYSESETRAWVDRNLEHQRRHGFGLFTLVEKLTATVVGDCGFELMEVDGRPEIELGYDLARSHWGRGLASEAAAAALEHGFSSLGFERIVSLIRRGNARSVAVARRIGMRADGWVDRGSVAYERFAIERDAWRLRPS